METRNYTNDAVELLKELIAIPSVSRNETNGGKRQINYRSQST